MVSKKIKTLNKEYLAEMSNSMPIKIRAMALYGSWARGVQSPDSDLDLLIISDEVDPKRHRRGREIAAIKGWLSVGHPLDILLLTSEECISNFKNHNPLFLDIAYEGIILLDEANFLERLMEETRAYVVERRIEKLKDGWRFPVLYREPTVLSEISNKDFAQAMFTDGERDLTIGTKIRDDGYYDKAVYHYQQAVEKAVKAVLIAFGEFKKTHFVGSILIEKLKEIKLDQEWQEKLSYLARISEEIEPEVTWSRYPGIDRGVLWMPSEEYTIDDAQQIKIKAEEALKITRGFLGWWFR